MINRVTVKKVVYHGEETHLDPKGGCEALISCTLEVPFLGSGALAIHDVDASGGPAC